MGRIERIYIDTSVIGGLFDPEFQHGSERLLELIAAGRFTVLISEVVEREIEPARENVRMALQTILAYATRYAVDPAAENLRDAYLAHNILSERNAVDALHVAMATVAGCDAIVSWNFKHIVNSRLMPLFNAVNVLHGYNELGIYTPHGVIGDVDTN